MTFSNLNRTEMINTLTTDKFDVLIIGGGITGAGIALDAAARGMKTALVEMQDFAAGTSSRSTKLVHGGLRYLKQFEVKMVAEVGKERAIVYENGPHVTTPEWMLLPMHKGGTFGKFSTSIGLRVYDFLAGVRKSERRSMLTAQETISKEPLVKKDGLKGGGYYVEYRTDDARLTIEVMKAAADKGAMAVNYLKVEKLIYDEQGNVCGAAAADQLTGKVHEISAKKVINAAGPWVDSIREKDGSKKGKTLRLTKGVHLVIDQSKFPLKQAVYFDTPDKRMVFAIPRDGKTYVGTTDTFYDSDPVNPKMTASDRTYIINAINFMFPSVKISENDIESSWAGVRPLIWEEGKDPSEISRKDEIWESDTGLLTIAGGKLTGYRKMAETIVDLLAEKFKQESNAIFSESITKTLPISGGSVGGASKFQEFIGSHTEKGTSIGLSAEQSKHLVKMYGSNVGVIFNMIATDRSEAENFGLPIVLWAKLKYAIEHELAATPVDFFNRRTGALLFDIDTVRTYQKPVISYMAEVFKWDTAARSNFEHQLNQELSFAVKPADQD
ncbi:glycerol-3-phosphate dehydrogenase [Sporosarcina globispora]|uniref:Glycerol-3-phosphate dehydrogenase n=1 Tax=Sporosarcina globispora TaxID=1459 RepID=A0A0M0GCX3_SPOGL|nr:glycerol-3-phosphate dehydrogenase/oxidase [Sporosarcina globispora]KON87593.1 glycerol-3-phosphate dehydrogenase [Sporosarcina globispora]